MKLSLVSDTEIEQTNKFIDLLKLPYCLIDVNQGLAKGINGLDDKQKSTLAIETSTLILFIEGLRTRLQAEFDSKEAAYLASQTDT